MVVIRVLVMRMVVKVDGCGGNQGVSGNDDVEGSSGDDIGNGQGGAGDSGEDNESNRM